MKGKHYFSTFFIYTVIDYFIDLIYLRLNGFL